MTTTYELTTGTKEEFIEVQAQLTADFAVKMLGALVASKTMGDGYIMSCTGTTMDNAFFEIGFETGETKKFLVCTLRSIGFLSFIEEAAANVYDYFMEEHNKLKAQYNKAVEESQRREKEDKKKAEQLKKAEAKNQYLKEKAIKDFEELTQRAKQAVTESDEFYYGLGWLAAHIGSISATMPDYLAGAFEKHFGNEAAHRVVDSNKRTVNGNSMQWTFGFKATLKNPDSMPAALTKYLSSTGKAIANTAFIWDLVTDYGFKFGKEQDTLDIMRCVPIQYVPIFNEGLKA